MEYSSKHIINLFQLINDKIKQIELTTNVLCFEMEEEFDNELESVSNNFNLEKAHSLFFLLWNLLSDRSYLDLMEKAFPDLAYDIVQAKAYITLLDFNLRQA